MRLSGLSGSNTAGSEFRLNTWLLSLSESATNSKSLFVSSAIPIGVSNWPVPVPVVPNSSTKHTPFTISSVPLGHVLPSTISKIWILSLFESET